MQHHEYVKYPEAQGYPVVELSDEEKAKIDGLNFDFRELNPDHIVYGLSHAFGSLFHNMWQAMEKEAGEEMTRKVTYNMGFNYGFINYGNFLKARGVKRGSPALMCEFQDKIHSIRGTVHIAARYGQFDDEKCIIRRNRCIYNEWGLEGTKKYIGAFYDGILDGYRKADPALKKVEVPVCLWKGDGRCQHTFWYK